MQLFTIEQANRTLPLVRKIVEDIVREHSRWRDVTLELDLATSTARSDEPVGRLVHVKREAARLARELEGYQRELESLGIQLKDKRLGLVDFPSDMDGRTVLLCWRLGETDVQYWHEVDSGYAGRRPLFPELVG